MSDTQHLPALSTLDKAGLQKAYAAELGKDAADELTVVELREALTQHRSPAPASPTADSQPTADQQPHLALATQLAETHAYYQQMISGLSSRIEQLEQQIDDTFVGVGEETDDEPEGTIVAVNKEGKEKRFSQVTWDLLGPDKGGFEPKPEKPDAIK